MNNYIVHVHGEIQSVGYNTLLTLVVMEKTVKTKFRHKSKRLTLFMTFCGKFNLHCPNLTSVSYIPYP